MMKDTGREADIPAGLTTDWQLPGENGAGDTPVGANPLDLTYDTPGVLVGIEPLPELAEVAPDDLPAVDGRTDLEPADRSLAAVTRIVHIPAGAVIDTEEVGTRADAAQVSSAPARLGDMAVIEASDSTDDGSSEPEQPAGAASEPQAASEDIAPGEAAGAADASGSSGNKGGRGDGGVGEGGRRDGGDDGEGEGHELEITDWADFKDRTADIIERHSWENRSPEDRITLESQTLIRGLLATLTELRDTPLAVDDGAVGMKDIEIPTQAMTGPDEAWGGVMIMDMDRDAAPQNWQRWEVFEGMHETDAPALRERGIGRGVMLAQIYASTPDGATEYSFMQTGDGYYGQRQDLLWGTHDIEHVRTYETTDAEVRELGQLLDAARRFVLKDENQ